MLTKKDMAIVIATYNRHEEVERTLKIMKKNRNVPKIIFIIDQSKDGKTKGIVKSYSSSLPVHYVLLKTPSSSIAKNIGINKSKKAGAKLILIVDDDVDLNLGYLNTMLYEFNSNPELMGATASDVPENYKLHSLKNILANIYFKFFFLPHKEDHKFRMLSPYGNTSSPIVNKTISDAAWLLGFNMCYRAEVFRDYKMPESRGYNVLEDIDSSYYTFKKYGSGSLAVLPSGLVWHRFSPTARYEEKKRIFVNHEDHFYFYYTYFKSSLDTFKFYWSILGILIGNSFRLISKPKKENYLHLKYIIQAIAYCYKHRNEIKNGKLRKFLNDDLSMKEKLL